MILRLFLVCSGAIGLNLASASAAAPTVTSVSVPASGPYGKDKPMEFTVNFSEAVFVVGFPILTLQIGSEARNAIYQSGAGTSGLLFRYEVQSGDSDEDGIAINGLSLNAATIKNSSNEDAVVTLNSVASTSEITVETIAPQVTSIKRKSPSSQTVSTSSVVFEVTFSEDVTRVDPGHFTVAPVNGSSIVGTVVSVAGGPKMYDVSVNISSGSGEFRLDLE